MAGERFKLNFITNGEGIVNIQEPFGFDAADFTLKQESKRYGRDVFFAGGESEFKFTINRDHYFDTLIYYYETFGWEAEVQLIIEIDGFDNIIGDFDFFTAKTDLIEEFSCKVVQSKKQALIKKRRDVKIDLFSSVDLDDNEVTPITTENLLVKAKPIKQSSRWETTEVFESTTTADSSLGTDTEYYAFNPINLIEYNINDSYQFFDKQIGYDFASSINNALSEAFKLLTAQDNLKDITVNISELDFMLEPYIFGSGNGYVDFSFVLKYGTTWATATQEVFFSGVNQENEDYTNNSNFSVNIPSLNRGDSIWLYFFYKIRQSASSGGSFRVDTTINSMTVEATATATSYNTIAPSVRLYDACYQTVKKISQMDISFPFAEPNGEMYNQRLVNGNFLRNILNKPFYLSMKDIEEWLPEINGDYEVGIDETVYFGLYADYYRNHESGYFDTVKFDDYEKMFNDRYAINQLKYKYNKFQSQKENEVENTYDVVHGESEWLLGNVFVENKKEVNVGFVRDAFLIAELQKKALTSSEDTATQDDDTIFIIDTIESTEDYVFTETDFLQHIYDTTNNRLELNNTGNFSFLLIGITAGEQFRILGGDTNAGTYTVYEVTNRKLTLTGGTPSVNNNGERNTQFEYIVTKENAPFKTWGNEGFDIIDGIINTEDYANLKYSIKRNIVRFYNQYLATSNLFAKKVIKNTFYKNNPNAILSYGGLATVEGESFTPNNPLLSPYKHSVTVVTDFATYKTLENDIRTNKGYVRIWDRTDFILKLYPMEMTFVNSGDLGELTIIGEEKYETSLINISYNELGYLTINDYYRTAKIKYKVQGEKFYIFDETNRLLYKPAIWTKITVNQANATSKEQLIEWLTLIS